jgi:hypothetical protein
MAIRNTGGKALAIGAAAWLSWCFTASGCGGSDKGGPTGIGGTTAGANAVMGAGTMYTGIGIGGNSAVTSASGGAGISNNSTNTKTTHASGGKITTAAGKSGGSAGKTGGTAGTAGNGKSTNGAKEPKIPPLSGKPCPKFADNSTEMILSMNTMIRAGTPGATKGPLLFAFHFTSSSAVEAMGGVAATAVSDITGQGGIIVAPQSEFNGNGTPDIAIPTNSWFEDDIDWVDHVVSCAVNNNNIDPKRIYAVGCSAGGLMAGTLGLVRSSYIAAVGPNSGGIHYADSYKLQTPDHAPAVITLCGGAGDNVIINFCDASGWMHDQIVDKATAGGFIVNCDHGMGHCGGTTLAPTVWAFLKAHPFGVDPEPYKVGLPSDYPPACKIIWKGPGSTREAMN